MKRSYYLFFMLIALSTACTKNTGSNVKLDNGARVFKDDSEKIPGVVYIGGCTATAVSDTTLITAAHCLAQGNRVCIAGSITSDQAKGECTDNVTKPSNYVNAVQNPEPDFAIAIFKANTFTSYFPVSLGELKVGDPVLMVGYSKLKNLNQPNPENEDNRGSKRWGKNRIAAFSRGYATRLDGTIDGAGLSQGDSGGPLFNQKCELVGAASTRGDSMSNHSNSSANQAFFKQMEAKGAYFCGLTGNDAARCGGSLAGPISDAGKTSDGRPVFPCGLNAGSGSNGDTPNKINNDGLSDSEIKIKIHENSLADNPLAIFSVAKQTTYIEICATATINDCTSANGTYIKVQSGFALGSRKAMSSKIDVKKNDGTKDFVIIARDDQDAIVASRTFTIKSN